MRHTLQFEQWVPYPPSRVFAFFANPENLPPLMPRWQRARIERGAFVEPPAPPGHHTELRAAGAGTQMTISFCPIPLLPLRIEWKARITEFVWDDHFCDEQISGPFAYWLHCHRLRAEIRELREGTLVTDVVTYQMKLGPLGELADRLGGARQMRSVFLYRQQQLLRLLATPLAAAWSAE